MCWDWVCARLSCFPYPAIRPQSTAWASTGGELLDYLWSKFLAALEHAGRGAAQKILRNTELPLEQTRGRPGRWSDYVCSATSTAFARQKKASGATESPQQSSRWTQTWPDFLSCCRSGKLKGKEKAQEQEMHRFCCFLCGRLPNPALGKILISLCFFCGASIVFHWGQKSNKRGVSPVAALLLQWFLVPFPCCQPCMQCWLSKKHHFGTALKAVNLLWVEDGSWAGIFFKFRPPNVWFWNFYGSRGSKGVGGDHF